MNRLLLIGLNHSTAPLALREKLALGDEQREDALKKFQARFAECEAVMLSTCNRIELYAARATHGHPRFEEAADFLADLRGVPANEFKHLLYHKSEREVVEHLFNVSASLDSMVIGETQILGQVREAHETARAIGAAGPILDSLFQRAIAVGKQVMTQTQIAEGRLSVASVAVDYASKIFDHFNDKTVLSVGAGKMAALVLQSFTALKPGQLLISNRDTAKAQALASRFNGSAAAFENLDDHLVAADIVVTSTGSPHTIITRQQFEKLLPRRRFRPIFLIDIALPRDVEADVANLENVYLYNLDDLQQVVAATQSQRREAIDAARAIVGDQVNRFVNWTRGREMGPFIDQLYARYHAAAQQELQRTLNRLPNISEAEKAHLEELARRIVNKLLHDPVKRLRESEAPHGPAAAYLHALEKLFEIDDAADDDQQS